MFRYEEDIIYLICDSFTCESEDVVHIEPFHWMPPEGWIRLDAETYKYPGIIDSMFRRNSTTFYCSRRCLADHVCQLVDGAEDV